jgi:tetratricopeptide (TPR) repeat protein
MAQTRAKIKQLLEEDKIGEADELANAELSKATDNQSKALAMISVADVALAKRDVEAAVQTSRDAWPLSKETQDKELQSEVLISMVKGFLMRGSPKEALKAATSSLSLVKESKKPALEASILHLMAAANLKLGDADDALAAEEKAMAIHKKSGDKKGEAVSLTTIASAYKTLGRFDDAIAKAKEACASWRPLGHAAGIVLALETISEAQAAQGYPQASLAVAEEELSLLRKAGANTKNEVILMEKVAQIAVTLGQKTEALRTMEGIIKVCKDAGDKAGEAQKTLQTAEMHLDVNHSQDALRLAKEAEQLFAALGDKASEEEAKKLTTSIYVKRGQHSKAPHRAEALQSLKAFIRSVEQREFEEVKRFEADLDKASSAIKDTEMSAALESLFERDPSALQYLEQHGWDLESFKVPLRMRQFPHKAFYLSSIAGGMNFGPQFRSVNPWRKASQDGTGSGEKGPAALALLYLPETESWQGQLLYRHGVIDGGLQSSSVFSQGD